MAEKMVRKQSRFTQQQMILIKRLAKECGVSESEVIRQALERDEKTIIYPLRDSEDGWEKIRRFVKERQANYAGQGKPVQWNRQELYEEPEEGKKACRPSWWIPMYWFIITTIIPPKSRNALTWF